MKNFRDPFQQNGAERGNGSAGGYGNMQSASQGATGSVDADSTGSASIQEREQGRGSKGGAKLS